MGTLNLLECVRSGLPDLHRLVYASTEAVYWRLPAAGRYFEKPITEEMVSAYHQMPYFLTKWVGEELCMAYHLQYGIPSTVFRFSTVIEPGEFLNDAGLPSLFLLSTTRDEYERWSSQDPAQQRLIDAFRSLSTGEERLLLSQNPDGRPYKQHFSDVRDIVQGLVLGIENEAAIGEVFNLAGAALFDWAEAVDYLAGRYGLGTVEARLPYPNYFELDLAKIQTLLGYQPEHDLASVLDTAEAMGWGEDTGVIPTGVRFDGL